jgi:hypothetical protein
VSDVSASARKEGAKRETRSEKKGRGKEGNRGRKTDKEEEKF